MVLVSKEQSQKEIDNFADQSYKYGFETIIDSDRPEKGINKGKVAK